jgi:hypothetical protein
MTWRNVTIVLIGGKVKAFSGEREKIQKKLGAVSPVTTIRTRDFPETKQEY